MLQSFGLEDNTEQWGASGSDLRLPYRMVLELVCLSSHCGNGFNVSHPYRGIHVTDGINIGHPLLVDNTSGSPCWRQPSTNDSLATSQVRIHLTAIQA